MRRLISLLALVCMIGIQSMSAAPAKRVVWTTTIDSVSPTEGVIQWHAAIEDGWHIYGSDMPPMIGDMPTNPTTITLNPVIGLELQGDITPSQPAAVHYDNMLDAEIPWWEQPVTFSQRFTLSEGTEGVTLNGDIHYMACDISQCTPPTDETFSVTFGKVSAVAAATSDNSGQMKASSIADSRWWRPVEVVNVEIEGASWIHLLWLGFIGGLVALLTPCVWPMIPMTVSFFLKTNKNKKKAKVNALIYSLSIIVIFLVLGLAISAIFGGGALNDLATSALFNIIFFLLLVVFAISFMGAFEIKLPAKWSNAIDSRAESTSGVLSIFFMAFTLVLVSFSCTGPIIGTLLVEAVSESNLIGPMMGMTGFAVGLALPFGLFAFFPSMLNSMPKSGGWLNSVKVVLGFIELILSLKFLSVADLAYGWRLLDREVFIAIWIVLFVLLGMYLLGKLRFSHDSEQKHTSVLGFFLAVVSLSFAVYLVPGLWGAPLKSISAFAPPISTQDFNLYGGEYEVFDDYDEGMAYAEQVGKPVFVDFTGYGCVNCRKMEMAVFDTPDVRQIIEGNYVFIRLYVDEKAVLPHPIVVTDQDGQQQTLKTYGEKWSFLQSNKFGILSQPYYVLLNNEGQVLNTPRMYDENLDEFVKWLEEGIKNYRK